jgi:hypothetical protein
MTSRRQQGLLAFISEYTCNLVFVPGLSNLMADALSRPAAGISASAAPVCAAIRPQRHSPPPNPMPTSTDTPLQPMFANSHTGFGDLDLCWQVFDHLIRAAHPGMRATCRLITSSYVWKGLSMDVTAWASACLHCQQAKVHPHVARYRPSTYRSPHAVPITSKWAW